MTKDHRTTPHPEIAALAKAARAASRALVTSTGEQRNQALDSIAQCIRAQAGDILTANALDVAAAGGMSPAMLDRLRIDPGRLEGIAQAVQDIAALPDIIGRVEHASVRPNGLEVSRVRIPLGVVAMIYESRPNVTTDAAALCIKSANAVVLRGGSEAVFSNRALGAAVSAGLESAGLPARAVQVVGSTDRDAMVALLACDEDIDVVIPRGGEGLIRFVAEHSRIPVLKHYKGVCHIYVHAAADTEMATRICENAKVQRPGVCNAVETILVDHAIAPILVPTLVARLTQLGVEVRGDPGIVRRGGSAVVAASDEDWGAEYLDLIVAMRVVDDIDHAIEHIATYGSNHTESIITADASAADRFLRDVQSSTVMVNASTRFADGGELGLGAEIGISTTKLHAYGPMGAEGLTTTKFVVRGRGQTRT